MPRQTNSPQSRERRLRRVAQRAGFSMRKVASGRERGLFYLDPAEEVAASPFRRVKTGKPLTLDEVEAALDAPGAESDDLS